MPTAARLSARHAGSLQTSRIHPVEIKPIRFSHSQIEKFDNCPYSWYRIYHVKDVVRIETEATRWGAYVHQACEDFLLHAKPLPANVQQAYGDQLAHILTHFGSQPYFQVEPHYAIDISGTACDPEGPSAWAHGYIDVLAVNGAHAWIGDYKTGKSAYPSGQLKLYSAFLFAAQPQVQTINAGYFRLQHKRVDNSLYSRSDIPALLQPYAAKYARLTRAVAENNFPAIPGRLCRFCDVTDCAKHP